MKRRQALAQLMFLALLALACGGGSSPDNTSALNPDKSTSPSLSSSIKLTWSSFETFDLEKNDRIDIEQNGTLHKLKPGDPMPSLKLDQNVRVVMKKADVPLYATMVSPEQLEEAAISGHLDIPEANALSSFLTFNENLRQSSSEQSRLGKSQLGVQFWMSLDQVSDAHKVYEQPQRLKETFGPMVQRVNLLTLFAETINRIADEVNHTEHREALATLRSQILTERSALNLYNALHSPALPVVFLEQMRSLEQLELKGSMWLNNDHSIDLKNMKRSIFEARDDFLDAFAWPGAIIQGLIEGAISSEITIWAEGKAVTSTQTDPLGKYSVEIPIPGAVVLRASKVGYHFEPEVLKTELRHGTALEKANFKSYQLGSLSVPPPDSVLYGIEYTSCDGQTKLKGRFKPVNHSDVESYILRTGGSVTFQLIDGSTVSGQFDIPDENEVKAGVSYGLSGSHTGNFVGTGGSTIVPESGNVLSGILYMDSAGGAVTGSYVKASPPNPAHVLSGISYTTSDGVGSTVNGTLTMPAANLVLDSLAYTSDDGSTIMGKASAPSPNQVLTGITFSNNLGGIDTGLVALPSTGQVEKGVAYGPSGSYTGTLSKTSTSLSNGNFSGNLSIGNGGFTNIDSSTNILGIFYPEANSAGDGQVMVYDASGSNLYFADAFDGSALQVTGGVIDGTTIGTNTPAAAAFTSITATSGTLNGVRIGTASPDQGTFTTLTSHGGLEVQSSANLMGIMHPSVDGSTNQILTTQGNGHLSFVSANVILQNTSVSNLSVSSLNSPSIAVTGGTLNGVRIGTASPDQGTFTTLTSHGGLEVQSSANLMGIMHPSVDGSTNQILTTQGNGHLSFVSANVILQNTSVSNLSVSSLNSPSIAVTGGSLDGVVIGSTAPTSAIFTTINGDTLTLGDDLSVSDNLTTSKLTVNDNSIIGSSTTDSLTVNSTIKGGALGGNVWFQGNLISASNTYSLGIAARPWSAIYAIRLVTTSDERAKKEFETIGYGLDEVMKLNPVSYNWKEQPNPKRTLGLIAQEVNEVIEEVVVDEREKGGRLGIEYHTLVPVLIQAIKDQQEIINDQRDLIDGQRDIAREQERRLNRLERLFGESSLLETSQSKSSP